MNYDHCFINIALVFMCLPYKSFENTVEKEKLPLTSNFSFSHSVFYLFEERSSIFFRFQMLSANCFSLEECKLFCLGNG